MKLPCRLGALAAALLLGACSREVDLTLFKDVTAASGLPQNSGMTHGAAWGDVDGDGRPDLYVTNHLNPARLYRNEGNGRFVDVTAQWLPLPSDVGGDKHAAMWADFDNSGRQSLVQLTGATMGVGAEPKRLMHNRGDHLVDEAPALGVDNPEGRDRSPLWLDIDRDGRLDLFEGAEARFDAKTPPFLFHQQPHGFAADTADLPLASRSAPFCRLAGGGTQPRLLCRLEGPGTALQMFDLSHLPAATLDALPQTGFEDAAVADFDNSGQFAIFMARRNPPGAVAIGRPSPSELVADLQLDGKNVGQPLGLRFRAGGPLRVTVHPTTPRDGLAPGDIHIGSAGTSPAGFSFEVTPDAGAATPGAPGERAGLWIGATASGQWELHLSASRTALASGKPGTRNVQVAIAAAQPIDKLEAIGEQRAEEAPSRLFVPREGKYVEESDKRGVNRQIVAGASVVAGDFDNDGHVDLFILGSGEIGLQHNLLLLNDGKGGFRVVKDAGGAPGGGAGVGDCVATADFDGNGRLGLLVVRGASMGRSLGLPSDRGGYRLYRNVAANGNHWLEIDLEGTRSNRDGIGAIVRVTANGVTQSRLQDGGQHNRCQNHARLHFGLAQAATIDKITVHWPSGTVQQLNGVAADRVLHIKEAATP